jgi:hypothetical protein
MQKSVGAEYWFGNILALRAGYKDDPYITGRDLYDSLYYGFGVRLSNFQVDYANIPGGGPDNVRLNTFDLLFMF